MFQIAEIVLESVGPLMGGRAVSVRWLDGTATANVELTGAREDVRFSDWFGALLILP